MYKYTVTLLTAISLLIAMPAFADKKDKAAKKEREFQEAVTKFKQSASVSQYFQNAYGYALYPTIGKGGMGIGGSGGSGRVFAQGSQTGTSSVGGVSIGFQFGGQAYSQVIFFQNKAAYDKFTSGKFEFGAQAQAIAIQASAGASAGTTGNNAEASGTGSAGAAKGDYTNGMVVFTAAKGGLMYEASLGGQKYSFKPL